MHILQFQHVLIIVICVLRRDLVDFFYYLMNEAQCLQQNIGKHCKHVFFACKKVEDAI